MVEFFILTATKESKFKLIICAVVNSIGTIARFIIIRRSFLALLLSTGHSV